MGNNLDNDELVKRLAEAEEIIEVLRNHEVDAIVGKNSVLLVRLKEAEDELRKHQYHLQELVDAQNQRLDVIQLKEVPSRLFFIK